MEKPTVEQVAWVFKKIVENDKKNGTFRYLIYDTMGFDENAYYELYTAGGMYITNGLKREGDLSGM